MNTAASRYGPRMWSVPLILLAFLLVVFGFGGTPPAAAEPADDELIATIDDYAPADESDSGDEGETPPPEEDAEAEEPPPRAEEPSPESAPEEPAGDDTPASVSPKRSAQQPAPEQTTQEEIPTPEGQSDRPAPPSREKRVLEDVHTDAVSVYLDDGELVAETQADVDEEVRKRLVTQELLFHLSDAAKGQIQENSRWSFLGNPGDDFWLAPEVQQDDIIWPGFSTEDPNLRGSASSVDVRLLDVDGPGRVEIAQGDGGSVHRLFSSEEDLGPWRLTVPQHVHAFWAFTEPGTYTFTFEVSGSVDGRQQSAQNDYTFVVGDLDAHTQGTHVSIEASSRSVEQGEPVLFTASMEPEAAAGAMQFRDLASGTVLGHTPVVDGEAQFRADALNPGERRIIAEFVPTWSTDFEPSNSSSANVTVEGEVQEEPTEDDTEPVPNSEIEARTPGTEIVVTGNEQVVTGYDVTARATDSALAGHWLSVWLPGQSPAWRGWVQADQNGNFSVNLQGASTGYQRLVVKDAEGEFVGWDSFEVVRAPDVGGGGDDPGGNNPGGGGGGGSRSAAQDCRPEVTLDHGHIDAFYVSAANGTAVMQLMEDVTGSHVLRQPETTLLKVKESALGRVGGAPSGVPSRGYWLPLSQDNNLIWPGWDTNTTRPSGHTDVSINITGVNGPGTVSVYTEDQWGAKRPLLNGGRYNLPGTIRERRPAHTHAHWVFSEKGIYTLTANAVATNPSNGRTLTTGTHTYVFQVGNVPLGDVFCGLSSSGGADAAAVNAAVDEYAADALAAAQADSEAGDSAASRDARANREGEEGAGGFFSDLFGGGAVDPALLAGLLGLGGGLLVSGIAGGTIWYVIRLRKIAPAAIAAATA